MILAGYLSQVSLTSIIRIATEASSGSWFFLDFCRLNGIPWLLLILISAGVTVLTVLKREGDKVFQGIVTFVSSFLINCGGGGLGYMAIICSIGLSHLVHSYVFLPVMALASLGIIAHLIKSTPQSTKLPDPEVILLGICIQLAAWYCIEVSDGLSAFCKTEGIGFWLLLLGLSCIPSIFTVIKTTENFRVFRLFGTFIATFLFFLTQNVGYYAIDCAKTLFLSSWRAYGIVCIVFNALLALAITVHFMTKQQASPNLDPVPQSATVIAGPHATCTSYPMQDIPPQPASYPPPQASHPPPQVSHPPSQASYPPVQASYPPTQASYPYHPASHPVPPPQASYSPQQASGSTI